MKVTVFSSKPFEREFLTRYNEKDHSLIFLEERLSKDTFALAEGCSTIVLFTNDNADADVLEKLHTIGVSNIALRSAGYDHVDLKKAKELNIKVSYVPDYSPYSIAEHSIALILAMNRKLKQAQRNIENHDFRLDGLIGFDLNGKTVGIIGTGKIGGIVAKILHGFGCTLLGYDVQQDLDLEEKYGLEYVPLNDLCRKSDIVTIHCPLNEQTRYMIDKERFGMMKKGVMIQNSARGPIINTLDLIEGLKSEHIGYAGLDVYEKEKGLFFYNHSDKVLQDDIFARLLTFKNVLITSHQAFLTQEALSNIAEATLYNIDCFEKNEYSKYTLV